MQIPPSHTYQYPKVTPIAAAPKPSVDESTAKPKS